MGFWSGLFIGFIIGSIVGIFMISLVSANRENNDLDEQAECLKKMKDRNEF